MPRELVATEAGFYRGALISRGDKFTFHGEKMPRWAIDAGEALPPLPAEKRADTKPPAAAKAAKLKASAAADQAAA